jgi:peroxiredoxin
MKHMDDKDTDYYRNTCDFRKLPDDTIFGKAFSMVNEPQGHPEWNGHFLYTGNELVYLNDTATILSCAQWADEIKSRRHNFKFFSPLTARTYFIPSLEKWIADTSDDYLISLSETHLNDKPCYLVDILVKQSGEPDPYFGIICLRYEINIRIDKSNYLPIQFSEAFDNIDGPDTVSQYEELKLVSFDPKVDESKLTLKSIPDDMVQRDYVPHKAPEPLSKGTPAPDWSLPTLAGDTVRLTDLKGKVVLVDFFYKSCAPCCAALPILQSLHEKYKDRGVVVVGIDPYDNPVKDEMVTFLAKRGITYTVLFSDHKLTETYHVHGFPTLFILDRDGKIVDIHTGFSKEMGTELEEQLQKML